MEKLNELGLELKELKSELLNDSHSGVIKRALALSAEELAKKDIINVDLHLSLTDEKIDAKTFESELFANPSCLKTKEEMMVEFEKIREQLDEKLEEEGLLLDSESLVDTDQLSFAKTFKLDKPWVSEYFGQPNDEVDKLMVRNGFVEKFAVLRLSKILEDFLGSDRVEKNEKIDCKATRVFYDVEEGYYGISLIFYLGIEEVEDDTFTIEAIDYMKGILGIASEYVTQRLTV